MHRIALLALFASTLTGCQEAAPGSAGAVVETAGGAIVDPASGARCAGHDVRVTRDDFRLVLEGDCGEITVTGSNGSLNVTHARSLQVAGDRLGPDGFLQAIQPRQFHPAQFVGQLLQGGG